MPIIRTFMCPECATYIKQELPGEAWKAGPPSCPSCDRKEMQQDFRPIAISNGNIRRASKLTEDILENDYNVADIQAGTREGDRAKVRYKEPKPSRVANPSSWGWEHTKMQEAMAIGRHTRTNYGDGLDVLQSVLKSGHQPDLLAESKKAMIKASG